MDWAAANFQARYAPNSRETFRRQTMHQFVQAGICTYNPDKPDRPVNSPQAVYQIEPSLHAVLKTFGTPDYADGLNRFVRQKPSLSAKYAKARQMKMVPVSVKDGRIIQLSVGNHSQLMKAIIEDFGSRYAPGGEVVYVGDTGSKIGFFDEDLLGRLGVEIDTHGKFPDVVLFLKEKNWLFLIESVTSHGPVDAKRQEELAQLFRESTAGLVYVSAFPNRRVFLKYIESIAWESEVWIASAPSHLIHFDGLRFLGPYPL